MDCIIYLLVWRLAQYVQRSYKYRGYRDCSARFTIESRLPRKSKKDGCGSRGSVGQLSTQQLTAIQRAPGLVICVISILHPLLILQYCIVLPISFPFLFQNTRRPPDMTLLRRLSRISSSISYRSLLAGSFCLLPFGQ